MKKLLLLIVLMLTGCSSYQVNDNRIASILAVTEKGDTISVPYKKFLNDRYTEYTRFNYNNNWYWNNWRYDWQWRYNYWYYGQLDYYNNYYNNTPTRSYNFSNPSSKRGEKVTVIPPENDGIYVPPSPPKPPKDKKDNIRIWNNPRPAPGNSVRRSFNQPNQPSYRQNSFSAPRNNFSSPRSYSAPRSSAPTRSSSPVQSAPSGGKGSSTGKIN
jgi:hypothetical protein